MRFLFLLFVSLLSLVIGLGVFSVYHARTHSKPAETFLTLLGESKPREAFDSATTAFREGFTWTRFGDFVYRFHLADYRPGSFRTTSSYTEYRQGNGLTILVVGDARLRDGTPFHLNITLCKEDQLWKVEHIYVNFPRSRFPKTTPVPSANSAGIDAAFNSQPLTLGEKREKSQYLRPKPAGTGTDHRDASPAFSPAPTLAPGPP